MELVNVFGIELHFEDGVEFSPVKGNAEKYRKDYQSVSLTVNFSTGINKKWFPASILNGMVVDVVILPQRQKVAKGYIGRILIKTL